MQKLRPPNIFSNVRPMIIPLAMTVFVDFMSLTVDTHCWNVGSLCFAYQQKSPLDLLAYVSTFFCNISLNLGQKVYKPKKICLTNEKFWKGLWTADFTTQIGNYLWYISYRRRLKRKQSTIGNV